MTNWDKQGAREDSWPGRERGPQLCREMWGWRCCEAPGNGWILELPQTTPGLVPFQRVWSWGDPAPQPS